MTTSTIKWTNRASILAGLDRWPEIFEQEIVRGLEMIGELLVGATIEGTPVSDGALAGSINRSDAIPTADGFQVSVGDSAVYGDVIEQGRRPGARRPPTDAILAWVWSHRQFFDGVETEKDAKGVAFVVARKIGLEGFSSAEDGKGKGWGMYAKAVENVDSAADAVIKKMRSEINRRATAAVKGA